MRSWAAAAAAAKGESKGEGNGDGGDVDRYNWTIEGIDNLNDQDEVALKADGKLKGNLGVFAGNIP